MIFIPADNALSLSKEGRKKLTLGWHLRILQFQFVVVYFFGGLAKINSDWIFRYEPVSTFLKARDFYFEELSVFLAYSGLLFDLFIGFFLLIKKTRVYALILVLLFNVSNHLLFNDINIFPFFMMASSVLFFELNELKFFSKINKISTDTGYVTVPNKLVVFSLCLYVLIQVLMPLRHFLIPGNVDWTGEGQRFAWRMKIQAREIEMCEFAIFDLNKKTIYPLEIGAHIHEVQKFQMIHSPKMILDFAHYLKEYAKEEHQLNNIMVKAKIKVRFNQRKSVEIFSPEIDLTKEKWNSFNHNEWINPLE